VWGYGVLAVVVLFLLFNTAVLDFARLFVLILLAALGAAWIELARRQTLAEFPDASSTFIADTRARMSSWWESRRAPSAAEPVAPAADDVAARLASLAQLHSAGELTDEEFTAAKAQVLGRS